MRVDFKATKQQYDLAAWAESNLGLSPDMGRSRGDDKWYRSPFRDERTASFVIHEDSQTWYDFGNDEGGDIYELIRRTHNVSLPEAYRVLTGSPAPARAPIKPAMKTYTPKPPPTFDEVVGYYQDHKDEARHYFVDQRGLSSINVDAHMLGVKTSDAWYNWKSEKLQRRPKIVLKRRDYTIPYLVGQRVVCLNKRRDDSFAREQLFDLSKTTQDDLRVDIAATMTNDSHVVHPEDVTVGDMLNALFRDKYIKQGADYLCYNANALFQLDWQGNVETHQGNPVLRRIGVLAITEGEIDALSLCEYGLSAVAMKARRKITIQGKTFVDDTLKAYVQALFRNVVCPVVIADNDEAGLIKAHKTAALLGRNTRILIPPAPYKDANEMHVAGALRGWLQANRIIG